MPDDLRGQPFPDGEEPEYRHHGAADDEFASVVFDEDFVRSAAVHEPTAVERILAAAQSHAESETARGFEDGYGYGPGGEGEFDPELDPDVDADLDIDMEMDVDIDDDPDDEGRFDRSDYSEYVEPADGDETGHDGPYGPFGPHSPYGPHSPHAAYSSSGPFGAFGHHRHPGPRFDVAEEHGSDYRPPFRTHRAAPRPYGGGHVRWQRPIAWLLAVVMGIGMLALALSAVYRGTSGQRQDPAPPPATSEADSSARAHHSGSAVSPSTSHDAAAPAVGAHPREG
ncbi:MAG: hypothetical protein ACRDOV_07120 [Streptomyces sp.]